MQTRIITLVIRENGGVAASRWGEGPFAEEQIDLASKPDALDDFMHEVRRGIWKAYDEARAAARKAS